MKYKPETPRQKIAAIYVENDDEADRVLIGLLIDQSHKEMDRAQECADFDDRIAHYRAARLFLEEVDYLLTRDTEDSRL